MARRKGLTPKQMMINGASIFCIFGGGVFFVNQMLPNGVSPSMYWMVAVVLLGSAGQFIYGWLRYRKSKSPD